MTPTLHLAPVPDGLRAEVDLPIAAGVTTLVGPNAAGKSDVLEAVVVCLDRSELADLRGYLAQPLVKKSIAAGGGEPFRVPSDQVGR